MNEKPCQVNANKENYQGKCMNCVTKKYWQREGKAAKLYIDHQTTSLIIEITNLVSKRI